MCYAVLYIGKVCSQSLRNLYRMMNSATKHCISWCISLSNLFFPSNCSIYFSITVLTTSLDTHQNSPAHLPLLCSPNVHRSVDYQSSLHNQLRKTAVKKVCIILLAISGKKRQHYIHHHGWILLARTWESWQSKYEINTKTSWYSIKNTLHLSHKKKSSDVLL